MSFGKSCRSAAGTRPAGRLASPRCRQAIDESVWEWFRWLYDVHGIKLTIFYDSWDRGRFLNGIWTTIHLSFVAIVLSIVIGIVGAWLQLSRLVWVRRIVQGYIQFFRNTPP